MLRKTIKKVFNNFLIYLKFPMCPATVFAFSHTHLADTIKKETGKPLKYFYNVKIIEQTQKMLIESRLLAAEIARICCYYPSNF